MVIGSSFYSNGKCKFFVEIEFLFSDLLKTASVNTQDDPSHTPTGTGNDLYYREFAVDVSGLLPGFGIHFDLYDTYLKNGDTDIGNFAPFSHDAGTIAQSNVPEPSILILLGLGLAGFGLRRRARS